MQLQYVLANPQKRKSKKRSKKKGSKFTVGDLTTGKTKSYKRMPKSMAAVLKLLSSKKKVGKKRKSSKIKKVGSKTLAKGRKRAMAKLTGKKKAAFLARMAAGRRKAAKKGGGKGVKQSRRRRHGKKIHGSFKGQVNPRNPRFRVTTGAYVPVKRHVKAGTVSKRFPSASELSEKANALIGLRTHIQDIESSLENMPDRQYNILKDSGSLLKRLAEIKKLNNKASSSATTLNKLLDAVDEAQDLKKDVESAGGSVTAEGNPRKRKGKKKGKKHHSRKRKGKKGHSRKRKSSKRKSKKVSFKFSKRIGGKKGRKIKRITIRGFANPMPESVKQGLWIALGFLAAGGIVKGADSLSGGAITNFFATNVVSKVPQAAPFVAPALAGALAALTIYGVKRGIITGKIAEPALHLAKGAAIAGVVAAAYAGYQMVQPQLRSAAANLPVVGPTLSSMLSGVQFFPTGMSGADFGMYPQMGSSADFGVIPAGMNGIPYGMGVIPAGLRGVQYFPNKGMGEVEFFPDGSDGNRMFQQSEAGDLMEAEGLGSADFGSADFGIIPSGMGDGQLG